MAESIERRLRKSLTLYEDLPDAGALAGTEYLRIERDGTWYRCQANQLGGGEVGGGITDGDKGDVVVSSGGTVFVIDADVVGNTKLANMAQATIKGRTAGAGTGDPVDLTAAQVKTILALVAGDISDFNSAADARVALHTGDATAAHAASAVSFTPAGSVAATDVQAAIAELDSEKAASSHTHGTSDITDDAVTNAKLANMATARLKGRVTASTGDPEDLTGTQATTLLDTFTSALKGLAPASGGGTTNFLRADGTWAEPPAVGGSGDGAGALLVVASSTAPAAVQARADYVCDGTADEVQINTALALGSVYLTDGDYFLEAPITITEPGTKLMGAGRCADMGVNGGRGFGTMLFPTSTFTGTAVVMVQQNPEYVVGQFSVHDFSIDGSNCPAASLHGVFLYGYQFECRSISVRDMTGDAFHVEGDTSPSWDTYDCVLAFLMVRDCAGAGIHLASHAADGHILGCILAYNQDGIRMSGGSSWQIVDVHTYSNSRNNIRFESAAGTRTKIVNLKCEHAGEHGIYSDGSSGNTGWVQLLGAGFNCNGESVHNTYSHIYISGTSQATKWQIIGAHFGNSDGASNLAQYAINLKSYGTHCIIMGCWFGDTLAAGGVATGFFNCDGNSNVKSTVTVVGNYGLPDYCGSPAPTAAAVAGGGNAGTSPPAPVVVSGSTDKHGKVTFGTGTGSPGTGALVTVTFNKARDTELPSNVMITPANVATAALNPYLQAVGSTSFSVGFATAPPTSQANTIYAIEWRAM